MICSSCKVQCYIHELQHQQPSHIHPLFKIITITSSGGVIGIVLTAPGVWYMGIFCMVVVVVFVCVVCT